MATKKSAKPRPKRSVKPTPKKGKVSRVKVRSAVRVVTGKRKTSKKK